MWKEELPTTEEKTDVILGAVGKMMVLLPVSVRAKALFASWGWKEEMCIGIVAPDDPSDLFNSSPSDFEMEYCVLPTEKYDQFTYQEIALPGNLPVVH